MALVLIVGVGATSAVATPAQSTGARFLIQYKASFVGDWSIVTGPGTRCPETNYEEQSGTFSSSVKTGSRKYVVDVYRPFTSIQWDYTPKRSIDIRGIVTSKKTAQGWFRKYCDAPPRSRQDIVTMDNSGCTAETFPGFVGLHPLRGGYLHDGKPERVFFSWEWEREHLNCQIGSMWLGIDPQQQVARPLDFKKLHRCGIKKPRGCRLTIGGAKNFSYSADTKGGDLLRRGNTEYRGKSRLEWSVTFVAIGRSPD